MSERQFAELVRRLAYVEQDLNDLWVDLDDGEHIMTVDALTHAITAVENAKESLKVEGRTDDE